MPETDVLVVGGGPVGLALAGDLGWRGINCMLVEATDGEISQPKMDGVNVRTMEFCRRWGIVDVVKSCPYPPSYPQDMVYLTSMTGFELGREVFQTPSGGVEDRLSGPSPEVRVRCPQNLFDPILRGFARSHPTVSLCYETKTRPASPRRCGRQMATCAPSPPSGWSPATVPTARSATSSASR
jgi:2-polyprenyl-6-methoxyphenol hydroxylase-like FAD-dependent oxidoreductase